MYVCIYVCIYLPKPFYSISIGSHGWWYEFATCYMFLNYTFQILRTLKEF